jgi:sugar phosphate isomerase/epimerase
MSHRQDQGVEDLRRRCRQLRAEGQSAHFARDRRSLAELAEHTADLGVAIGLENRYHFREIPDVDEAQELLAAYPSHVAGCWHDVGHAEVLDRLGLVGKGRWLGELGQRCLGAHLHDVDGLADHRPPGRGDAGWTYVARGLPERALRVFEISQQMAEEQVAAFVGFLRNRGVLASPQDIA